MNAMPCAWYCNTYQGKAMAITKTQAIGSNATLRQFLNLLGTTKTVRKLAAAGTSTAIGPLVNKPRAMNMAAKRPYFFKLASSSASKARQRKYSETASKPFNSASAVATLEIAGTAIEVIAITRPKYLALPETPTRAAISLLHCATTNNHNSPANADGNRAAKALIPNTCI